MTRTKTIKYHGEDIKATFVNPGEWFKKRWLVGVGCGFSCLFYVVEAGHEQDAIDALVDSEWGHIVKTDDMCNTCNEAAANPRLGSLGDCSCSFAGNYSERVDLDDIRVLERIGK